MTLSGWETSDRFAALAGSPPARFEAGRCPALDRGARGRAQQVEAPNLAQWAERIDFSPARAHASNLRGRFGVIPGDTQPPGKERIMFNITLRWPLVTLAVTAGLLAVAGPASG